MERFRKNMKATVKGDDKMADLKAFDMVIFSVLEFNHYYLLVFELKNTSILVIDNSCDKYPFVRMLNYKEYFKKDSCYKIATQWDFPEVRKHPTIPYIIHVLQPLIIGQRIFANQLLPSILKSRWLDIDIPNQTVNLSSNVSVLKQTSCDLNEI
ncbi:hypothetical protein L1987_37369 [Smallanthus sonchifolius]|uniref:Uncharacterized protein n=1 Tax=Smallanthus sonchifolius TaxID=185202 RepID=A0ACB9HGL3_9ASTR|nr:hypothetical protein L1987_37369 [Smallanthus sonchifolius]